MPCALGMTGSTRPPRTATDVRGVPACHTAAHQACSADSSAEANGRCLGRRRAGRWPAGWLVLGVWCSAVAPGRRWLRPPPGRRRPAGPRRRRGRRRLLIRRGPAGGWRGAAARRRCARPGRGAWPVSAGGAGVLPGARPGQLRADLVAGQHGEGEPAGGRAGQRGFPGARRAAGQDQGGRARPQVPQRLPAAALIALRPVGRPGRDLVPSQAAFALPGTCTGGHDRGCGRGERNLATALGHLARTWCRGSSPTARHAGQPA